MRSRAHHARLVVAATIALAATTCSATPTDTRLPIPLVFDVSRDAAVVVPEVDPTRVAVVPAEQLRGLVEHLLAWHGVTLMQVLRGAHRGETDLNGWTTQLVANTVDLTGAIGIVYGPDAAHAFNQQWAQHTQFLVDYAVAIGNHDRQAAADALAALEHYAGDSGSFFTAASDGALSAGDVARLLSTHVGHMVGMIDSIEDGNTDAAITQATADAAHLATVAKALVTGIAAQQPLAFPGPVDTADARYRSIVIAHSARYIVAQLIAAEDPAPDLTAADLAAVRTALAREERTLTASAGLSPAAVLGVSDWPLVGDSTAMAAFARAALDNAVTATKVDPAPAP